MATPEVMHDLRLYHFKQFARIGIYAMLPRWRAPLAWLRPVSSPGYSPSGPTKALRFRPVNQHRKQHE
jgi:hypothetical protein